MSCYWKQSLWIGGIYWIISQAFTLSGSLIGSTVDAGLSLLLVLFLIPMNWLKPIKRIDAVIKKSPIISTLLVSVGWVPYVVGIVYVVSVAASVMIMASGEGYEYRLFNLFQIVIWTTNLRQLIMVLTVLAAVLMIFAGKRTIAGRLDKHFKLIENEAVAATVNSAVEKTKVAEVEKKVEAAKPEVKKAAKENVKKTTSKPKAKKVASEPKAKKAEVKKEVKPAAEKTVAAKKTVKKVSKPKAKAKSVTAKKA